MKRNAKFRALIALTLCVISVAMLFLSPTAQAYEHPKGLWKYFDEWSAAVEAKDYAKILHLAPLIEALYEGEALNMTNSSLLSFLCENAARGSELAGDLPGAVEWLQKQLIYDNYINANGKDYNDRIILTEALIRQLDVNPDIYTVASKPTDVPYFGVKGEPRVGTLFGSVAARSDAPNSGSIKSGESGILVYVEFEPHSEHNMQYWMEYFTDCEKGADALSGRAVIEVAWNFAREGNQLSDIVSGANDAYIIESAKYLGTLDTTILLRVGAEMNVWTHAPDEAQFKAAFKKIAGYARQYAPNVALVFSPNDVSAWGKGYKDFYPGDEYVDWIGSSTYFTTSDSRGGDYMSDAFYHAGIYSSDPTARIRLLAETFPNKPIMISECGFAYNSSAHGDRTADAVDRLSKFYSTVAMRYPQVKAIFYFDTPTPDGKFTYHFTGSSQLKNAYLSATSGDTFLKQFGGTAKAYTRLSNVNEQMDVLKLYTDALFPSNDPVTCVYTLDGKQIKTVTKAPFECEIIVKDLAVGVHTVRVDITCGKIKRTIERQFTVGAGNAVAGGAKDAVTAAPSLTAKPTPSKVYVDGKLVDFDAYNIAGNNYFKLRDVAFVLNGTGKQFSIEWDASANAIRLTSGADYTPDGSEMAAKGTGDKTPKPTSSSILLDGEPVTLTAYNIDGNNYFKIRDLGKALDFGVTWDGSAIQLGTDVGYTE